MNKKLYKAEIYLTDEDVELLKKKEIEMNEFLETVDHGPKWTWTISDTLDGCLKSGVLLEINRLQQK